MEDASKRFLQTPANKVCSGQKLTIYRDAAYLGEWLEPEVRKLYAGGLLFPTDYCRREGTKEWQRLDQFVKPGPRPQSRLFRQH
ncbi:MAG: hypothetical protein LV481_06655 [Methylacidiphilales bacterium]|nr:hypothetical protein [Candidatus Methylacidiphilales bacterium]